MTGFGAFLAMCHVMFGAFVAARLADVSAKRTDRFGVGATPSHGCCSQCTDLGAIHIQCNALGHHLDNRFMQTGNGAVVTGHRARVACFNAGLVFLVRHSDSPGVVNEVLGLAGHRR